MGFSMRIRDYPRRVVCLTEESVETLFALGLNDRIIGVSAFVERPAEAKQLPTMSVFTHANLKKIADAKPDLVLGFSDIQKDIAKDLIGMGLNVWIANHRTLDETLDYILALGSLFGVRKAAMDFVADLEERLEQAHEFSSRLKHRPKVYIEEWDEPMLSGISWFSEIVRACGGEDIFVHKSSGSLAKDRAVESSEVIAANPDIILGCWCGKPVDVKSFATRTGWKNIKAVENNQVFELDPAIFLQPGPAPILAGIPILQRIFSDFQNTLA
ncbi:MAG: cobalamin-binding protein [Halobacteriovorax sp.]|nr:cobalamin-binding protein [Halobacteriovorax sp.]